AAGGEARRPARRLHARRVRAADRRALRRRARRGARRRHARPVPRAATDMRRELARQLLHLLVLWAFAVAEPLFDLLGRTPEFFVVRGSKPVDIVVFAIVVALVPPALLVGLEALVALASTTAERALHLAIVATLAAAVAVQLVRKESHATLLVFAAAAALGVAFAAVYPPARGVPMCVTVRGPV